MLLRAGDSLVLFTDGVTEARSAADRDLYGDDRLREVLATLHDMSADQTAAAIQQAVLTFSGGKISDDLVALVLTVPPVRAGQAARARGRLACRPAAVPDNRPPAPAPRQPPDGGLAHDREDLTGPPDDAGLAPQRCHGQPAQRRALTDRPTIVVHEAPTFAGLGAEIAATITERCFDLLEAPVRRVGA
jgi:hypothetical protein